jgi:hypothetical protein
MKLDFKKTYLVNGIEYTSLEEARKAAGILSVPKEKKDKTSILKSMIDISKMNVSPYMGKMTLYDAISLADSMSNEKINYWVPSQQEMISLVHNNKITDWNETDIYWTSSKYKHSTYIIFNCRLKEFDDIFSDLKYGVRFLFKENLP